MLSYDEPSKGTKIFELSSCSTKFTLYDLPQGKIDSNLVVNLPNK